VKVRTRKERAKAEVEAQYCATEAEINLNVMRKELLLTEGGA
jgi:hypothetical protein